MSLDSVNTSTATVFATNRAASSPAQNQKNQSSAPSPQKIEDTIYLSPEAIKVSQSTQFGKATDLSEGQREDNFDIREQFAKMNAWREETALIKQYSDEEKAFDMENSKKLLALKDKLNKEAGGILRGVIIPNDLSKPILTLDGRPNPKADMIRTFIKDHQAEWDQMNSLSKRKFVSFEDWKKARPDTAEG